MGMRADLGSVSKGALILWKAWFHEETNWQAVVANSNEQCFTQEGAGALEAPTGR